VWAITKVIFNYTGSPGEKIPQKFLRGLLFLTHTVVSMLTVSNTSVVVGHCGSVVIKSGR